MNPTHKICKAGLADMYFSPKMKEIVASGKRKNMANRGNVRRKTHFVMT